MMTSNAIKERPALMSGAMVRSVLDGRKSQTRRIVKPKCGVPDFFEHKPSELYPYYYRRADAVWDSFKTIDELAAKHCPYGRIGDRLWCRETWRPSLTEDGHECYGYRADLSHKCGKPMPLDADTVLKWKPSIFMPRKASRITLEITNIRIERLQDISEEDAIAEGIESRQDYYSDNHYLRTLYKDYGSKYETWLDCPIQSFRSLWDSINAKRCPWESNCWVWVIEFKRAGDTV